MPVNPRLVSHSLADTAQISYRLCGISRAGSFLDLSQALFLRITHQFNPSFIDLLDRLLTKGRFSCAQILRQSVQEMMQNNLLKT